MFFRPAESPLIAALDRRISALMNLPFEHGEGLQVLRYEPGARSAPHFDFLIPSNEANRASITRSGQRVSTLIVYLNDVEAGGETVFPELGWSIALRRGAAPPSISNTAIAATSSIRNRCTPARRSCAARSGR
ncbi:MAG: 2OG-Fe(II) oxygenase [Solimonas sp.]